MILQRTELVAAAVAPAAPAPSSPADVKPLSYEDPALMKLPEREGRIIGYDVARALAILGMLVEHSVQVFGPKLPTGWGEFAMGLMDGRASAVFVVLAGAGVSLLSRGHDAAEVRGTMLRRGSLLFLLGVLNVLFWQGDVLRLFGVTMMAAGLLHRLNKRWLLGLAIGCVATFPVLYAIGRYAPLLSFERHWDWENWVYKDPWSLDGLVRGMFYNGYRAVFPWAGLLLFGMWLGRLDVRRAAVRRNILLCGVVGLAAVETLTRSAFHLLTKHPMGLSRNTIENVFDLGSLPPMPPFMLSMVATALTVIGLCLVVGARWPKARGLTALSRTGQMALTWYILHIFAGTLIVWRFGWHHHGGSVEMGLWIGLAAFACMVIVSAYWRRHFRYGPFEYLLRVLS